MIRAIACAVLLSGALTLPPLMAQPTGNPAAPLPTDPAITIGTLDNGLTYYIRENRKPEKRAELRLVVNAGSILEDDRQQGLAHFVEHMAFNGTENFERQELVDYLESIGMRFGPDLNAYTSFDETVYMLQIPTDSLDQLDTGLKILAEWAVRVTMEDEEIDKERGVVIEEWRRGRGADARMRDEQFPVLFHDSRYADRLPIGQKAVLDTFHHETLRRFYRQWYRPDLMAIVCVGDVDGAAIEARIRSVFGAIPAPPSPTERPVFPVPGHAEPLFSIATDPEASGNQVDVYVKSDPLPEGTEGDYRRNIVESLYIGMLNNRLDELRREADPPFLYAGSGTGRFVRSKSFFVLSAQVQDGGIPRGLEALLTEAERVRRHGFTPSELERQKTVMMRGMESAYAERDKTASRRYAAEYIRNFLVDEPIPGIEYEFELYRTYLPGITLGEVNALTERFLTRENQVVTASAPEKEGVSVPDEAELQAIFARVAESDITAYEDAVSDAPLMPGMPEPGAIVAERHIPAIGVTEWTLSNGATVVLKATDFQNDEVLVEANSPGGHSLVSDDRYIPARTAASIVGLSGLGTFSAVELEKKLAGKDVRVGPSIGTLQESLSGSASPRDLETLLQLIHMHFTAPRIDSTAYLSFQQRIRGFLQNRDADPATAFYDTLNAVLTQRHFRTRPWSESMLTEMDLAASFDIYRERFADGGDFTFYFVGNIDTTALRGLVERYLASLPDVPGEETWRDVGIRAPEGVIEKTVYKGVEPQSQVRIVFTGDFEWTRQNRYDMTSMASVLNIMLREELREDKGGTYSVGVRATPSHYPVEDYEVTIGFGCAPERVDELIAAVFAQLDSLREHGPSEKNIQKVKETQLRQHETDLERNRYWLNTLSFYGFHGESPEQILKLPEYAARLDGAAVQAAARRYLDTANYVQVVQMPEGGDGEPGRRGTGE